MKACNAPHNCARDLHHAHDELFVVAHPVADRFAPLDELCCSLLQRIKQRSTDSLGEILHGIASKNQSVGCSCRSCLELSQHRSRIFRRVRYTLKIHSEPMKVLHHWTNSNRRFVAEHGVEVLVPLLLWNLLLNRLQSTHDGLWCILLKIFLQLFWINPYVFEGGSLIIGHRSTAPHRTHHGLNASCRSFRGRPCTDDRRRKSRCLFCSQPRDLTKSTITFDGIPDL